MKRLLVYVQDKETLQKLEKEKKHQASLLQDFDANSSQWTEEVVTALNYTQRLKKKFATAPRDQKLTILGILGQRIELKNKRVIFSLAEPFSTISNARNVFGDQNIRIEKVATQLQVDERHAEMQNSSVLSAWCPGEDSNFHGNYSH